LYSRQGSLKEGEGTVVPYEGTRKKKGAMWTGHFKGKIKGDRFDRARKKTLFWVSEKKQKRKLGNIEANRGVNCGRNGVKMGPLGGTQSVL